MKSNNIKITDFKELVDEGKFLVDKTLFIKKFLENENKVTLITRPKRFGKTLNMSMLRYFLDIREKEKAEQLFKNLKIWQEKEILKQMNSYPVLHIDLSDVTEPHIGILLQKMNLIMSDLYKEHANLLKKILSEKELKEYEEQENQKANQGKLENSLKMLVYYLQKHYGKEVILLIDGYDASINKMYENKDIEDQCLEFFAKFYGSALKNNVSMKKGLMMGLLPMAQTAMAEVLGNINVASVKSNDYAKYFGFSESEVIAITTKKGLPMTKVKRWYSGYKVGEEMLYNPWSMVNYWNEGDLKIYERDMNDIDFIYKVMRITFAGVMYHIQRMILGYWDTIKIKEDIDLRSTDEGDMSLLLFHLGYFVCVEHGGKKYFKLTNHEVESLMEEKTKRIMTEISKVRI